MMADKRVALISGANRGIGLEAARQLARKGVLVVIGSRDLDKGQAAILDAFCDAAGISRSAFFRSQLDACIRAASERPDAIARPEQKAKKPRSKPKASAPLFLASEFDELFGSKGA